jgi:uncharacterized oligopeptide transporter (OPT) family protein
MRRLGSQLTLRGIVIGCVGCVILTATSAYMALKLGALPWPIVFAAIISLFFLKALGHTTLNEANVTHTIMSAGAMVAGGLAFTIPGIWMLGHAQEAPLWQLLIVALAGVVCGLTCTALLRRHFMERRELSFPIGQAAAQTLKAGNSGGSVGAQLFGAMGVAGIYTFLREALGAVPTMLLGGFSVPGVAFGIYNSPMLLAVGFLVGGGAVLTWLIGALIGHFGVVVGGTALGLWELGVGQGIGMSLGMGVMMGCGAAVIIKLLLPMLKRARTRLQSPGGVGVADDSPDKERHKGTRARLRRAPLAALSMAAVALLLCVGLGLEPIPSVLVVVLVWVTVAMSSQSVGQTGIDPMEIFGLIVLLVVAACSEATLVQLFFVAAIIAVACGLAGDVMNDFKAGQMLGTDPRAQWMGQAIGGILGALVAVAVMALLLKAYGPEAFGPQGSFVAAQASVVATMISGIPSLPAFFLGLGAGLVLYLLGLPSMMLGLGIYLPFYLSFSAFLGAMAKFIYDRLRTRRHPKASLTALGNGERDEAGLIIASGLIGGESIVSVLLALAAVLTSLASG